VKQSHKTILLWLGLVVLAGFVYMQVGQGGTKPNEIAYSEFRQHVIDGKVARVVIHPNELEGELTDQTRFKTGIQPGMVDDSTIKLLEDKKVQFSVVPEEQNSVLIGFLVNGIPIILLVVLFFLFMRQLQAGGGKAMSFGKSKARMLSDS
jgi:cell division protease FtsH